MMREWKSEATLKAWASEQAAWIARRDENGNYQGMTKSRDGEREIVFNVLFGALLGLNWGEATRSDPGREQAIVDTAEFTFNLLVENVSPLARGYESVYLPLKRMLKAWSEGTTPDPEAYYSNNVG